MSRLDIGEPTDTAAALSDEQLDAILGGADTTALDAAADREYGNYLEEWGRGLIEHIEDGANEPDDEDNLHRKAGFANDGAPERYRVGEVLADILGGTMGQRAFDGLKQVGSAPLDHPRDRNGRYVDKGSRQAVAMARHAVLSVWMGRPLVREMLESLLNISIAQAREIRDEWKLRPSTRLEARLTKAVVKLLPGGKAEGGYSQKAGIWITIGGKEGEKGKHEGGTRVLIDEDSGEILGGGVPKELQGKKVSQFKELIEHHRKQQKEGGKNPENSSQNLLTSPEKETKITSGGGEKPKPEESKMKTRKVTHELPTYFDENPNHPNSGRTGVDTRWIVPVGGRLGDDIVLASKITGAKVTYTVRDATPEDMERWDLEDRVANFDIDTRDQEKLEVYSRLADLDPKYAEKKDFWVDHFRKVEEIQRFRDRKNSLIAEYNRIFAQFEQASATDEQFVRLEAMADEINALKYGPSVQDSADHIQTRLRELEVSGG